MEVSSASKLQPGTPVRFGEFLLCDKIGQGGMAEIFLAKSLGTLGQQRLAVIKRVLPHLSADPLFSSMLVEEAKLCARLNHRNIVQVTDLGRVDHLIYIAMEYVEGFNLNELLRRCTTGRVPLPAEFVFIILEETLRALDFAHRATDSRGLPLAIIHRDVSPTNVLISCEGEVKLCDFGIARATARDGSLPDGVLRGKFAYMSPEQARGERIDQRSDLFAAGILLWELVAGHRLFRGQTHEVLRKVQAGETPPLPDRGIPGHAALQAIVARALAPVPERRFRSARDMLDALGAFVQEQGLFASQLRFAQFLRDHFGRELDEKRRERERASLARLSSAPSEASGEWDAGGDATPSGVRRIPEGVVPGSRHPSWAELTPPSLSSTATSERKSAARPAEPPTSASSRPVESPPSSASLAVSSRDARRRWRLLLALALGILLSLLVTFLALR